MSTANEITAPDTTPQDEPNTQDQAAPGGNDGAADDGVAQPPAPSGEVEDVAAFSRGLESLKPDARTAADVAADAAGQMAATPADAPTPAGEVAPAPAAAPAAAPASTAESAPDEDTDKAVKELGLKGRAEERFRELTGQVREMTPLREALAAQNITKPEQVAQLLDASSRATEWEETIIGSTATPEQFGGALNVIKAINSGDPKLMGVAFDAMLGEVVELGKKLGREVPGLVDPLTTHPDLQREVEGGDLTRERAMEIARNRASNAHQQVIDQRRNDQGAWERARSDALAGVQSLNDTLKAADPDFGRKLPLLQPALNLITQTLHPSQWVAAVQKAYADLPSLPPAAAAPAPAPAPAPPGRVPISHMPARPTGTPAVMKQKPKTDMEAFELGLASLKPGSE